MSIKLSYEDFISIASISDPENFAHGLRADKNGVYAIRPFRPELLEDEELACIRPRNGWEEPMLRFPCSPDEMRIFFDDSCMAGYKESLDSFIKQSYISHEEASPPEHGMSERHKIHVFSAEERNKGAGQQRPLNEAV